MGTRTFLIVFCSALLGMPLFQGVDQGQARAEETAPSPAKTMPFRDPENVPKLRSTTNAQREEAARKAAEFRAEAARAALRNTTTSKTAPPPNEKGGAK